MKLDYRIYFINNQSKLRQLCESLNSIQVIAIDIETINWWNPFNERVALIQLAYRAGTKIRAVIIDALAELDPSILQPLFELPTMTKVMHNANFDAVRLRRHFKISTTPVHDTLLAARRSGEKRYSLKAQIEKHLHLPLNKSSQQSDWSLRPLSPKQLDYAALDAVATLLLYEHQVKRGLQGDYSLRNETTDEQGALPLNEFLLPVNQVREGTSPANRLNKSPIVNKSSAVDYPLPVDQTALAANAEVSASSLALLGIITELESRYSPEGLAASVDSERVGLAGWIIDRVLGKDMDIDESTAKLEIAEMCQRGLIRIMPTRKLEATEAGRSLWHKHKPL